MPTLRYVEEKDRRVVAQDTFPGLTPAEAGQRRLDLTEQWKTVHKNEPYRQISAGCWQVVLISQDRSHVLTIAIEYPNPET